MFLSLPQTEENLDERTIFLSSFVCASIQKRSLSFFRFRFSSSSVSIETNALESLSKTPFPFSAFHTFFSHRIENLLFVAMKRKNQTSNVTPFSVDFLSIENVFLNGNVYEEEIIESLKYNWILCRMNEHYSMMTIPSVEKYKFRNHYLVEFVINWMTSKTKIKMQLEPKPKLLSKCRRDLELLHVACREQIKLFHFNCCAQDDLIISSSFDSVSQFSSASFSLSPPNSKQNVQIFHVCLSVYRM